MSDLDLVWDKLKKIFPILDKKFDRATYPSNDEFNIDIQIVAEGLTKYDLTDMVAQLIWEEIRHTLLHRVVPNFWLYYKEHSSISEGFQRFQQSIMDLHCEYEYFLGIIHPLDELRKRTNPNYAPVDYERFNDCLKSALLSQLPVYFNDIVYAFYSTSFKIFANTHQIEDDEFMDDSEEDECNGCGKDPDQCQCQELINAFNKTNLYLNRMNLLDRLAGHTLTILIQDRIKHFVHDNCKGIFTISHLSKLEQWLEKVVLYWLTRIFNDGSLTINSTRIQRLIQDFNVKLGYFLYEVYSKIIIDQFFSIIIDFPESQPAIDDLKLCLNKIDLRQYLIATLQSSLENRLLHPGVTTSDIITGYVQAIKAIRHLDHTGILLESVTVPVKNYLHSRNDTVRSIVIEMIDDEGSTDLAEELARSDNLKDENTDVNGELLNWETWEPDPIDANPVPNGIRSSRSADIISLMIDIYGSKQLFINEYKDLLSNRLLANLDFYPEKEIRNLELLKLRFGEAVLKPCEVMLKDISDSKRINAHIQSDCIYSESKTFDTSAFILSSQFWPSITKETLEVPDRVKEEFKKFTKSYEAYKGNRTLCWLPEGKVNIEIEIGNRTHELTVTPTQATIIMHFEDQSVWHIDELSRKMNVPQTILKKKIVYWQTMGLVKEIKPDVYELIEPIDGHSSFGPEVTNTEDVCDDEEAEHELYAGNEQREEELQVFWSYILGMLTNLESMTLDRIHRMLNMFASHGSSGECSQEELKNFLQRKVRERALVFSGGVYQLPKV